MREYREVRAKTTFLELCKTPSLAAEVTVTAVERLGVDAAIIFADILLILEPMGVELEFAEGEGPVIHNPVRKAQDVERLREVEDANALDFVYEAIRQTRQALKPDIPLIGFCGAPFTLASYLIEGGGSKNYVHMDVRRCRRVARDDVADCARARDVSERADRSGSAGGTVV
jgi:uroporphyrinogen decarboxylase